MPQNAFPPFGAPPMMTVYPPKTPEQKAAEIERQRRWDKAGPDGFLLGDNRLNPSAFNDWLEGLPESGNFEDRRNDPPTEPWPLAEEPHFTGALRPIRPEDRSPTVKELEKSTAVKPKRQLTDQDLLSDPEKMAEFQRDMANMGKMFGR